MSNPEPADPEAIRYASARIFIEHGLTEDGRDQLWVTIDDGTDHGDKPALITALGMLSMARDSVLDMYTQDDER